MILLTGGEGEMQVEILKKRLASGVDRWNQLEERPYRLAMSVGAIHHDFKKHDSVENLLREADELMYENKHAKKRGAPPAQTSSH